MEIKIGDTVELYSGKSAKVINVDKISGQFEISDDCIIWLSFKNVKSVNGIPVNK